MASWAPAGQVQVDATFEGQPTAWPQASWRGRLRGEALRLKDVPVEELLCEFDSQAGAMRLRIPSASVAGGQLQAEITLEPRETGTGFLLKTDLTQLQLDRLAASLPAWRGRDIQGAASAKAMLSGTWEQRATWVGEGWLNASGERLGELPLLEKVFKGFFGILADRLGLEALRRGQITQAGFQWQLSQERLHTEDLRLSGTSGGEPVAVYARGSVGLDHTLDLVIEPELSEGVLLQAPSTSSEAMVASASSGVTSAAIVARPSTRMCSVCFAAFSARRSSALKCCRPSTSVLRATTCFTVSAWLAIWLRIAVRMKSLRFA